MLTGKDKKIEDMMNDEGMTHAEAMARADKMEKGSKETTGGVALPASLLPDVSVGKDVDVTICGKVTGKSGGMVQIKMQRCSVSVNEPMPSAKGKVAEAY